ncbi:hypothetical protein B0H14DRAFT_3706500 [Mycena olivaceomarginata]|nr:hypothetical protein B0H14DRAFT_3706500 [Mycena olivaceomarginata]
MRGWITLLSAALAPAAKSDRQARYASARLDHTAHRDLTARRITLMRGWITLLSAALASAAKSDRQARYASARLDHTAQRGTCVGGKICLPGASRLCAAGSHRPARYLCRRQDLTARRITLMRSWITLPSTALAPAGTSEDFHLYARVGGGRTYASGCGRCVPHLITRLEPTAGSRTGTGGKI